MRIALVSVESDPSATPGRPEHGAQGVHVGGLAVALSRAGHDVVVEAARSPRPPRTAGVAPGGGARVRHHPGDGDLGRDLGAAQLPRVVDSLRRSWGARRPDVVHAHSWLSGLAATAATRDTGLPLVVSFHRAGAGDGTDAGPHDPPRAADAAVEVVARRAVRILAATSDEAFGLTRRGVDGRVIRVVPNGVETEAFGPLGPSLRRGRRPRLLVVGSLDPVGGVYDAVAALARVRDAELLVAGGPATDDPDVDPDADPGLAALRVHADRVGVLSRVRMLGAVPRDLLPALMRSADVLVHVPHRDAFAAAALESMACERPVVASAVGTLREVVVDHVTGLLVPPADPDRLGRTLSALLGEPTMCTAFGIAGRDRVVSRFSWSRVVPAVEAGYDEARGTADIADPVREVGA
jgi:glycosyltransferase involved in cell wall biosynthesis